MIKTMNLKKVFRTDDVETTALDGVTIEVADGDYVAIMGPSGCGKSTLLNILGLLDSPTEGHYELRGQEVSRCSEKQRAQLRKETIGFVFQSFNLIDELTIQENVELPLLYQGVPASQRRARAAEALDQFNLTPRSKHFPQQLSGGQQQRAAVARAIVTRPRLILADEPTGNLDSRHGDEVMESLTRLNEQGTTIVMVTHSPTYAEYGRRTIHLFDGGVVTDVRGAARV